MNCTYGLSAKLPSFFDRKYFSCSHLCFNRNVVDVCEEDSLKDSLIIETVQEKLQQKFTPLLETTMSISSLSERIINALETSHLEDVAAAKQGRRKMKRRKKRKQRKRCEVIKEDEIQVRNNFTLFENEYLSSHVPTWDSYASRRFYDNTSFSHITSEKESAYSEDKLSSIVVRKRKKIRRKKRKEEPKDKLLNERRGSINIFHTQHLFTNIPRLDNSAPATDRLAGYDEDKIFCSVTSAKELTRKCNQSNTNDTNKHSTKDITFNLKNKNSCKDSTKANAEHHYIANKTENTKILGEDTNIIGEDTNIIGEDTKFVGEDTNIIGDDKTIIDTVTKVIAPDKTVIVGDKHNNDEDTTIIGGNTFSGRPLGRETFSKEQRRQLRRKMRNVKKRPESYVVLGLI